MLDEAMMRNLCVRSLPRGIDDLDNENLGESGISQPTLGTSTEGQMTGGWNALPCASFQQLGDTMVQVRHVPNYATRNRE